MMNSVFIEKQKEQPEGVLAFATSFIRSVFCNVSKQILFLSVSVSVSVPVMFPNKLSLSLSVSLSLCNISTDAYLI